MGLKVFFGDTEIAAITSVQQLEDKLREIQCDFTPPKPVLHLNHDNGNILSIGISRQECYVNYMDASHQPPYFSSLGNGSFSSNGDVVKFNMDNQVSEIPKRNCIPFGDLIEVAKRFFRTGARPEETIEWEMD